jgi:hypothetical protein
MRSRFKVLDACFRFLAFVGLLAFCHCSDQRAGSGILAYLPDVASLGDWEATGPPETAEGEDLFRLINGAAEIYFEYGFRRAAIQTYTSHNGKSINVELYELEDPASAYGAYTFKLGKEGQPVSIGIEGAQEDYYLNFWKGNHVVTVIGFDRDQETRDGLLFFARLIDEKIPESGGRPSLVGYVSSPVTEPVRVTYIEGNLGLSNRHELGTRNIFDARQGVVHEYDDYTAILLAYDDEDECRASYERAGDYFDRSDLFHGFQRFANGFSVRDAEERFVYVEMEELFIAVYIGLEDSAVRPLVESVWKRLESWNAIRHE